MQALDTILFALGVVAFLVTLVPFSPMTLKFYMPPRKAMTTIYRSRRLLWGIGALAFALLAGRAVLGGTDFIWLWIVGISAAGLTLLFWSGYVPVVMTPPRDQQLMRANEAGTILKDDDLVLGLTIGGEARAYPQATLARPHFLNDTVAGTPLTITYCILCNSGIAFRSELQGRPLQLQAVTAFNNNIIYYDPNMGNFIQQLDRKVIEGPDAGKTLDAIPVTITTWKAWKSLYPETKVVHAPARSLRDRMVTWMLNLMVPLPKLVRRKKPWHPVRGRIDGRLPAMSMVIGVEIKGEACAYPLSFLRDRPVLNETIGGEPIVILYDRELDAGQVFSRRLEGKVPMFQPILGGAKNLVAQDEATGSRWDVTGRAREGALEGRSLSPLPHFNKTFWFSWSQFKPGTTIKTAA